MGDQQNLDSQSIKDRAWTTDEIRKHSSNWSLAGDVGLFNLLNEFSHQIISRTHEVENAMDSLVHQTKMTSAKINNVINDFHMLSNLQFVENRVYDEDIEETVTEAKPAVQKTKEQREAEMLPKIMQAIELGLAVLDTAFEKINVNEMSDSEDEDISSEGHTILEPKDPYEQRPLPYIIGSEEFMKCDYAGLKDLVEEEVQSFSDESSISETDETSSEGEQLPFDEDKVPEKPTDKMFQNLDKVSSSDESELFGAEKDVNGYASDTSLDFKSKEKNIQKISTENEPESKPRLESVSSIKSKLKLPQVLPVPKLQEKKNDDDDDLFANEDEASDDDSPFRKKTGLFAVDSQFTDEKDSDLFGDDLFKKSPMDDVVKQMKSEISKPSPKKAKAPNIPKKKEPVLFDNDEDSEDDIFNTLMKTKKPSPKTNNAGSQDSSEKADSLSTPSSAPSTKPSGNAFDFVTGAGNSNRLFDDDSDGDDLFSNKKIGGKKFGFDAPGNGDNDDLFGIINSKATPKVKSPEENSSLFEDDKLPIKVESQKPSLVQKKIKDSLFEDSDSSDQEKNVPVTSPLSTVPKKKSVGLFSEDDDEDDIFNQVKKESSVKKEVKTSNLFANDSIQVEEKKSVIPKAAEKSKPLSLFDDEAENIVSIEEKKSVAPKAAEKSKPLSLFDDEADEIDSLGFGETISTKTAEKSKNDIFGSIEKDQIKKSEIKVSLVSSLFDDELEKESPPKPIVVPKQEQKKTSLFEDSDSFDLFAPKPSATKSELASPVKIAKSTTESCPVPEVKDVFDGLNQSKISSNEAVNTDIQIGFDAPADSSNVLNVINKGRAKITAKRRKPTRQSRLAALEKVSDDDKADTEPPSTKSDLSSTDDTSDSLFSSITKKTEEPVKLDYKAQEKKKMNIMSQLMSEVTTTKIGKKLAAEKEEKKEEEEEDIDIFSEVSRKDKSKNSFSFKPPEENAITSLFPIEKEESDDPNLSKSDSFEDDFFTEPAFQSFRSGISRKEPPPLDLEDDNEDDDDDLFSTLKSNVLPKTKAETNSNDLFDDDDNDIFADMNKEKYEMFPKQIYENDDDDDIFASAVNTSNSKTSTNSMVNKATAVKKVEKQKVDTFDDPLTGLLGDD